MRKCGSIVEFNSTLDMYKVSDATHAVKEQAIAKLYELNKELLTQSIIDLDYTISIGDLQNNDD